MSICIVYVLVKMLTDGTFHCISFYMLFFITKNSVHDFCIKKIKRVGLKLTTSSNHLNSDIKMVTAVNFVNSEDLLASVTYLYIILLFCSFKVPFN